MEAELSDGGGAQRVRLQLHIVFHFLVNLSADKFRI